MPIYIYHCDACKTDWEKVKFHYDPPRILDCPTCYSPSTLQPIQNFQHNKLDQLVIEARQDQVEVDRRARQAKNDAYWKATARKQAAAHRIANQKDRKVTQGGWKSKTFTPTGNFIPGGSS